MLTTEQVDHIRPGHCVTFTGPGYPEDGMLLEVNIIRRIKEYDGDQVWYLADLSGGHVPLFLIVRVQGHLVEYYLTHHPADIKPGNRRAQLDQGNLWLFEEPEDRSKFLPHTLRMSRSFKQVNGNTTFVLDADTICAEMRQKPVFSNVPDPSFIQFTHYKSDKLVLNPHLFVLEVNGLNENGEPSLDGGQMCAYQGAQLDDSRIEIDSV